MKTFLLILLFLYLFGWFVRTMYLLSQSEGRQAPLLAIGWPIALWRWFRDERNSNRPGGSRFFGQ